MNSRLLYYNVDHSCSKRICPRHNPIRGSTIREQVGISDDYVKDFAWMELVRRT